MASRGDINKKEIQPVLSESWEVIPFISSIENTGTFLKVKTSECFEEGIYPVIDQSEKDIAGYINNDELLYKGDLPIIIFGDHTRNIKYVDFPFAAGADGTKILHPSPRLDSKFFYYYLKALQIPNLGYSRHYSILKQLDVPVPLLNEQKQIAEKLDNLFAQIETIKKSTERIPELLKNFKQQILTYAVTGKLTEDYRNYSNAKDLHKVIMQIKESRISDTSNKTLKDKLEKIYFDSNSSLDFSIPKQWIPVNLDKICDSFVYGTSSKSEDKGEYPVIRMGNIQNGKLDWSDLKYTSDKSEYMKYKLNVGDILFNRTNSPELVGKTTVYDAQRAACYAGYIIKIDPYRKYVNPYYLNIVLNSQYAKRWCWENKTDGVSQSNINAHKISKFTIPYPCLSEQEEIVNRVQSIFAKLDIVEERYNKLCKKLDKLPQALLHKAFKGELL